MNPGDDILVAMLTLLRDQLPHVVDEITFGELDQEDRRSLALAFRQVAAVLEPEPVVLVQNEVR